MENKVNEYALHTREFLISKLDFLNGEVQEFIPTQNEDDNGIAAMDVKWESGIKFSILFGQSKKQRIGILRLCINVLLRPKIRYITGLLMETNI